MNSTIVQQVPNESLHTEHHTLPSVLVIGTDSNVLQEGSEHRTRMLQYASTMTELHILVLGARGVTEDRVQIGEHVYVYPTHTTSRAKALFEGLRIGKKIVAEHNVDIISTQDPFETALLGYLIKQQCHAKLQIQEHGDFFSQPYWRHERFLHLLRYPIGLWLVHHADCVRVVSDRIKQGLVRRGIAAEKMVSVPVRTDTTLFDSTDVDHGIASLRPENGLLFLTIGRLVPQKNLPLLVRAFRKVLEEGVNARLVFVGQGPEKQKMLALTQDLMPDKVTFLDWTDNPAGTIKAADVYILSSDYEGWGRVCIESLAAGTPLVMTDVGCAGEIVLNRKNGLVVPVRDVDALAEAMVQVANDNVLRGQLITEGHKAVRFLPTTEEHRALYRKSLECCNAVTHEGELTHKKEK